MSLKNNLERELGVLVKVRAGAPGSLNVFVDGEQVYSKKQTGRSPTASEILSLIRTKSAAAQ